MEIRPNNFEELPVSNSGGDTILDILNADCWRIILDYVSINDIVRSERASRGWQRVVWDYLAGVHLYHIENSNYYNLEIPIRYWNYSRINYQRHKEFEEIIQKMGPGFVKIVVCIEYEDNLRAIALHCPNLEGLTFYRTFRNLPLDHVKKCKQLKQIAFDSCALQEDYLSEMITSETVEELIINNSDHVTGRFLTRLRKYLKTLALNRCDILLFKYIRSTEYYLTKLTRLELNKNSLEILQNVHLLLDKMPHLEHLSLMAYCETDLGNELPLAIGRLSRLKEIHLWGNENVSDVWLAALARGCPALLTVNVGFCPRLTAAGLAGLCQARPALEELIVAGLEVTDADLATCALCCKGLLLLDASQSTLITMNLPERIAKPRARPLLLRLSRYLIDIKGIHYEGLSLRWNENTAPYDVSYFSDIDSDPYYDDDHPEDEFHSDSD